MTPRLPILLSALAPFVLAGTVAAQSLALKTAPIATGDQFFLVPSRGAGMGGLSVAIRDTLGDPWSNPGAGTRMDGLTLFAAPTGYVISDDIGAGFTFSLGGQGRAGDWFGGAVVALQQLQNPNRNRFCCGVEPDDRFIQDALGNDYVQLFAGRRVADRTAIGASYYHADLHAVEGVSQLYSGNARLSQDGGMHEWRAGVTHEFEGGGQLDAVALHRRLDMQHDVAFIDWIVLDQGIPVQETRIEENLDRTHTTGLHVAWLTPVPGEEGVTLGLSATANRKIHPKIPNYTIANIPRDPGNSTAFAFTAGIARRTGPSTVGLEFSWLPARSHTWAQADTPIEVPEGPTIPAGGRTVENWFEFGDLRAAAGYERDNGRIGYSLGVNVHFYQYDLEQKRYVERRQRNTSEEWFEWTPAWGLVVRPGGLSLRYTGRLNIKGFPEVFGGTSVTEVLAPMPDAGIDFLPAPSGPVELRDFTQWTHQVALSISVGRR